MAIELHHLHPGHDDELSRLKARIAELEEERRWRKFPDEKPEHHQWVEVFCPNHSKYKAEIEIRRWDEGLKFDVENQELYTKWKPLSKAPEEGE